MSELLTPATFSAIETIYIAGTRGPCAGVNMAEQAANQVLDIVDNREPVYTPWGIVHNKIVMERLTERGLKTFGDGKGKIDWQSVPDGSIVFYPAHGTPPAFMEIAQKKKLAVVNVVCPLVTKVHEAALDAEAEGLHVAYVGVNGHPETEGVRGEIQPENFTLIEKKEDVDLLAETQEKPGILLSQTTLATDEIKEIYDLVRANFPWITIPPRGSICYATDNRQREATRLLRAVSPDLWLVVGSKNSHNSQMLRRKAELLGIDIPAYSVDTFNELLPEWFSPSIKVVGMTSGASVPEDVFWPIPLGIQKQNPEIGIAEISPEKREKSGIFRLPIESIDLIRSRYAA